MPRAGRVENAITPEAAANLERRFSVEDFGALMGEIFVIVSGDRLAAEIDHAMHLASRAHLKLDPLPVFAHCAIDRCAVISHCEAQSSSSRRHSSA